MRSCVPLESSHRAAFSMRGAECAICPEMLILRKQPVCLRMSVRMYLKKSAGERTVIRCFEPSSVESGAGEHQDLAL